VAAIGSAARLKIGEVSRRTELTARTLWYYDEVLRGHRWFPNQPS